eukprot:sb/3469286/
MSCFSPLFTLNEETTYRLSHKAGLCWYIIDQCVLRLTESERAVFKFMQSGEIHTVTVTLHSFTDVGPIWGMEAVDQHVIAMELKSLGTELFREKEFTLAAEKYGMALKILVSDGCRAGALDNHGEKINSIRSNLALCFQKMNQPEGTLYHCEQLLSDKKHLVDDEKLRVKVLYRRAWAFCEINEFEKCKKDISSVLKLDKGNCDALKLRGVLESKIKDNNRDMSTKLRGLFRSY